jgi:antirestriction protein
MEVLQMEQTTIYLNTWGAYNNGCIGYGWMTPEQARDFIEENPERDGGEWFIADLDNYTGVHFGSLEYANVNEIIDTIETLNNMEEWERNEIAAIMEYLSTNDVNEAIESRDSYIIFSDIEQYHDSCDESLEFGNNELLQRYFDYEAFYRDCDFDIYEASNGVCILG